MPSYIDRLHLMISRLENLASLLMVSYGVVFLGPGVSDAAFDLSDSIPMRMKNKLDFFVEGIIARPVGKGKFIYTGDVSVGCGVQLKPIAWLFSFFGSSRVPAS